MKRGVIWTIITSGNLDEANNDLQFRNSVGQFFDGNIGTDKGVSGWAEGLSFSMS